MTGTDVAALLAVVMKTGRLMGSEGALMVVG
jgi:hypothetical protein